MAEKIFSNVRLGLKVDTLENWSKSTLPLKKGEVAFATVAASAGTGLTEPVVMMKIGEDGVKTFKDIEWNFYAKAADVLAACKSEDALKAFINGVITDAGVATDEALSTLAGRVDTLEGTVGDAANGLVKDVADNAAAILALEGLVGDTKVATQISTAITELDLANTYEAKGEAAKVSTALETYKTANDAAVQKNAADIAGEISRAKAAEEANATAIATIKDGTTIDSFADVEAALAGKQGTGDYSTVGHKHEIADVNGLSDALADAAKAGTDAAATAESNANAYTDAEIAEWVGDKTVGVQISEAIANYTTTTDMNTAIATAKSEAVEHANGLNTAMNTRVEALEAIDHDHGNKGVLDGITAEKVAAWDAAEQNAKDYADGLDEVMDGRVAALEAKFTGEDSVADQIADAVAAEAALREAADAELQAQIGAASAEGKEASGLHARIEGLEGLVGDKKVSEAISAAVKVETDRAEAAESGLAGRIKAIEDDYLTAADEKALQDQITTNANAIELLTNGVSADEVDGVNDLIQYVKEHGAEVTGMKEDIAANAKAIADQATSDAATYETKEDATSKYDELAAQITAKAVQADWNQNDASAADYVKNRTHYVESEGEVIDSIALVNPYSTSMGSSAFHLTEGAFDNVDLNADTVLQLTIDGMVYNLYSNNGNDWHAGSVDSNSDVVLSNGTSLGHVELNPLNGKYITFRNTYGKDITPYTAVISTPTSIKQLDEKFIPATIARVSDVDAITELVGDKKVSEAISDATNPLAERIVELEKVDHTHENATVLDGIASTDVEAWNAKVDDVTAAADSGLKATRTGNTVAIEIDDTVTFIFDCGDAGVTAE